MNKSKLRLSLSLAVNALIVFLEARALKFCWDESGSEIFVYYTQDSNLLLMLCSAFFVIAAAAALLSGRSDTGIVPKVLRYMSTCLVSETFFVVLFILSPMFGGWPKGYTYMLFDGEMLWLHTVCPILAMVSLLLFEDNRPLTFRHTLYAFIPTLVYAAVSITLNILRIWEGPYPFLYVYKQPVYISLIWMLVVPGMAYAFGFIMWKICRRASVAAK